MKINEIFYSLQGEGASMGQPRLFIRFSGCNLSCDFCDTKYHVESHEMTEEEKELLRKHPLWCITGGEPLLHQQDILNLIRAYRPVFVEIETNGSVALTLATLESKNEDVLDEINQFNVSLKEPRFQLHKADTEFKLKDNVYYSHFSFKFVYSDKESEKFINNTVKKYNLIPSTVWVMPEGKTREEQIERSQKVWNYCLKKGFNFSARLHVNTWDAKKGV